MARFKRFIHSVASGYVVLGAASLYSLASVPLALHYLSEDKFALWALMATITGYLTLIDLGMSGSVARLLIDHKDDRDNKVYGSLIQTGGLVLLIQGAIVWMAGCSLAPVLAELLKIPTSETAEFIGLLRWQSALLAFSFATKIFSHLLTAHQRLDIVNYGQLAGLAISYASLWYFFHQGAGVFAWIWANVIATVVSNVGLLIPACAKLKLFPATGTWGRAQWRYFLELFAYGKDLFLVAVGTQLITASQTMIITRTLGLQAAAAWSIGTKMFNLLSLLIWRIFDVSTPALAEMYVRGEKPLMQARYQAIVILSASLSGFLAVLYALGNSSFVTLWTHGKITWPATNDVLLGLWMIVMAILHCHNSFAAITKRLGFMRYVYFIEGLVFVSAALLAAKPGGLPAIIGCSIVCSCLFSGAYGVWRVCDHFQLPTRTVVLGWMQPLFKVLALFVPVGILAAWALQTTEAKVQLAIISACCTPLGLYLFLRFGITNSFQSELLRRAPKRINPLLRLVFTTAST